MDIGGEPPVVRAYAIETLVARVLAVVAAGLVLIEVGVLLAGVLARYVWAAPLTWSDELDSILFLWLSMLGTALAFHRGQHMRMSALADRAGACMRTRLEAMAMAVCIAFAGVMLPQAITYMRDEMAVTTPAMEISGAWSVAALPVGLGLILLFALFQVRRAGSARDVITALVLIAAAAALAYFLRPAIIGLGNWNLLLFFVVLVAAGVLSGVPIAFVFGLAAVAYVAFSTHRPLSIIAGRINEGMSPLLLLAVPLFVLLGMLMELTGMARAMVGFLASLLGHVRGGLSYVLIAAMYLVSGISGSKTADMAAIAPALFPEMRARGARPGELVALLAATGAQTETIPPSLVLITIGSVTSVSISALFTGGLVPALVCGLILCVLVWWRNRAEDLSAVARTPWRSIARSFVIALPAMILPLVIRAAVVDGVATATEVSTIAIVYAALAGILFTGSSTCADWAACW